jgi:predicted nucleotide-binding protein
MSKTEILKDIIRDGRKMRELSETDNWSFWSRVDTFLQSAYGETEYNKYRKIIFEDHQGSGYSAVTGLITGYLEGLLAKAPTESSNSDDGSTFAVQYDPQKVFVVHGHDSEAKETVARFIQKIGLKPIILHEQPSSGLTIIEKLESYSNVGFAAVLLTPDDIGGMAQKPSELQARARQNVILELGYFIGKLSRNRICALYKQGVEIPSDFGSIVYIELDEKGAWRTKLAQEFVHAGMPIEIEKLLEV